MGRSHPPSRKFFRFFSEKVNEKQVHTTSNASQNVFFAYDYALPPSGVARGKWQSGQCSFKNFFQWMKILLCDHKCPKAAQIRGGGINEANNFFRIRASPNFCIRLKSKKILLSPTELHAEMLVFEKLHKLINNWNHLSRSENFCRVKIEFLLSFVSFPAQRDLEKAQLLWIKRTNY